MRGWTWVVALCLGVVTALPALAEPGLGQKVYDPYVKNGVTEIEMRWAQLRGRLLSGETAGVFELEQGINDRLSLALIGEIERHVGEATKLDSIGIEGVYYLGKVPGVGVDVGGYLEYEQRIHNESGIGEAKLLLAKTVGRFQGLLNLIAAKPFSDRPGEGDPTYGFAASATWAITPQLRAGVQSFGNFGDDHGLGGRQPAYLGPSFNWEARPSWLPAEIEVEAGYLFALGKAADYANGQVRFMVELEKRF